MGYTTYQLGEMVANAATRYGFNPRIAVEQIRQESSFNPNAISPAGARGIAQFMPATGASYGLRTAADFFDPVKAIDAYARHMRDLLNRYSGDYSKALAAYNAGAGNVDKYKGVPPFTETRNYVAGILARAGTSISSAASSAGQFATDNAQQIGSGMAGIFLLGFGLILLLRSR